MNASGRLLVRDSLFQHNGTGIGHAGGDGTFEHVSVRKNAGDGVSISFSNVTLTGSTLEHNGGFGLISGGAYVTVQDSVVQGNTGPGIHAEAGGYLRLSTSLVTINGREGVLVYNAQVWLVDNRISDNLQTASPSNSEICACFAAAVVYMSGNAVTSAGATYVVDANPGSVVSYGNNALNGATHANFSTSLLR